MAKKTAAKAAKKPARKTAKKPLRDDGEDVYLLEPIQGQSYLSLCLSLPSNPRPSGPACPKGWLNPWQILSGR
jgi:hypothetical protein